MKLPISRALFLAVPLLCSCAVPDVRLEAADMAGLNPVTGKPLVNVVSERDEVEAAQRQHAALAPELQEGSIADAMSTRTVRVQRVFADLVAVAHRPQLPWQVHLIRSSEVEAFTPGGGYIYLDDGLFGRRGLVTEGDDDELAAVLAHMIAHVALMHTSAQETQRQTAARVMENPCRGASFSLAQELEADQLAALYMALAGYDARAAWRVWGNAARSFDRELRPLLSDHPLSLERADRTATLARQMLPFYTPGERRLDWEAIRADNPFFPRVARTAIARAVREVGPPPLESASSLPAADPGAVPPAADPVLFRRPTGASSPAPEPLKAATPALPAPGPETTAPPAVPASGSAAKLVVPAPAPRPAAKLALAAGKIAVVLPPAREPEHAAMPAQQPVAAAPPAAKPLPVTGLRRAPEPGGPPSGPKSRFGRSLSAALDAREPGPQNPVRRIPPPGDPSAPLPLVRFLESRYELNGGDSASLYAHVQNDARSPVAVEGLQVAYYRGSELLRNAVCRGSAELAAGESAWLVCDSPSVAGVTEYEVEIGDVASPDR